MEKFNVAIIRPNQFNLEKGMDQHDIEHAIVEHVELNEVTNETLMECVVKTINLTPKLMGDTTACYENEEHIYQICHLNLKDNGKEEDESNLNRVASYLATDNKKIYGRSVLLCSKITETGICQNTTLDMNTISRILYSKLVHKGVKIHTSGEIEEFNFNYDPLEEYTQEQRDNYKWFELPLFKFNLIVYIEKTPMESTASEKINKKMTKLFGRGRINGNAIVVSKVTENEYIDLDNNLINKILVVSGGSLKERELLDEEKKDGEKKDGLPFVINKYRILQQRYNNRQKKCYSCSEDIMDKNSQVCTGCYRVIYHSEICQKKDWENHKSDCLYGKCAINGINK